MTTITRAQLTQVDQFRTVRRAGVALELGTATFDIFTITDGPVLVYSFIGHITELIAGTALPTPNITPTDAGGQTELSDSAADIDTFAVNTLFTYTGLLAGLLTPCVGIGHLDLTGAQASIPTPIILNSGVIAILDATAAAVTGGLIDWYITYVPVMAAGLIVAA